MTPIYNHPKQQVAHPFISVQKIPEFVRQSGREALGFQPFKVEDMCLAHKPVAKNLKVLCQYCLGDEEKAHSF
jgi:hypothetical protein